MKNWVGLDCHPTDEYIHWRDKPVVDRMEKVRDAYDLIAFLGTDYKVALDLLMKQAYHCGMSEEADSNNPDL